MKVNGVNINFTFDTGAEVSVLSEQSSRHLNLSLTTPTKCLTGADGSVLDVVGMTDVTIKSTYRSIKTPVYVMRGCRKNLLGLSDIRNLNLLAVINNMAVDRFDPLTAFPKVFSGLGTLPGIFKIN